MNNRQITDIFKQEGFWLMLHFLLRDALALSLLAFAGLMTAEGMLPGFVSVHLNLAKVLFGIALLFFAFIGVGHSPAVAQAMEGQRKNSAFRSGTVSKWLFYGLLLWSSLLTLNALLKFPLYAIVIIFISTGIIGKLVYDEFF
jgi:hypothetical protein